MKQIIIILIFVCCACSKTRYNYKIGDNENAFFAKNNIENFDVVLEDYNNKIFVTKKGPILSFSFTLDNLQRYSSSNKPVFVLSSVQESVRK